MNIGRILAVCGTAAGAIAFASPAGAQSATTPPDAPYVNVSLIGTDLLVGPQLLRYRVTADAGAYVTMILISPRGQRVVLNPYESAIGGTGRRELVREARTPSQSGESYLVAIATRSAFHSSNLRRQSQAAARLASAHFSADGALDELLNSILPTAGNDFSAAYVSFRIVSRGVRPMMQYAHRCPVSGTYALNGTINDGLYRGQVNSSWAFDDFQEESDYFDFLEQPYFASACQDRLITPPLLVATLPAPVLPPPPRPDTAVTPIDSVPRVGAPTGPIDHHPVAPLPLNVQPLSETIGRATMPLPVAGAPVPPVREPLSPVNLAPRIDPVMPVQREPVSPPPVPMEPRAMPVQPMSPPPPPPTPVRTTPTPLPPATGTTPANPPPR